MRHGSSLRMACHAWMGLIADNPRPVFQVKELVNTKGMFSFYEDGHQECCRIRKVFHQLLVHCSITYWMGLYTH